MKKNYLQFMENLLTKESPFYDYRVRVRSGLIDVILTTGSTMEPSDIEWLKSQLVSGRWWLSADGDYLNIIVRFDDVK